MFGNDYNFGFCSKFCTGMASLVATDDDDGAEERVGKDNEEEEEEEFETDCCPGRASAEAADVPAAGLVPARRSQGENRLRVCARASAAFEAKNAAGAGWTHHEASPSFAAAVVAVAFVASVVEAKVAKE